MRAFNPVQKFALLGSLCIVGLCLALALAISYLLEHHMSESEWANTAGIVTYQVAERNLAPYFVDPQIRQEPARYREAFQGLLGMPEVVRIKIWDREVTVLWSDDERLIGKRFPENPEVKQALAGQVAVTLKSLGKAEQAYEREQFTRLAEIYVPVRAKPSGEILGVIEVYKLPARLIANIRRMQIVVWGIALSGGICLYVMLLPIVRRAYRKQLELEARLREHAQHLEGLVEQRTRKLAESLRRLEGLYAIDRTVSQSLDLEVILAQALEKICEVLVVEAGGFYLLEADGETMVLRVHRGLSPAFAEAVGRIRLGEGVSGQAAALRRPVAMAMADYPTPRLAPILEAMGIRYLASAPVISRGRTLGAINVGSRRARPFTAEELDLLGSIGQQVGASVENARLFKQVERAKAEWENTFDAMPDLVAIVDGEYHLVRVNRAMAERLSVAPEDLVGQRCYAVMHGTDAPWPGCPHPHALATGRPTTLELEDPHLGGIFHVTTSPLVDADGRAAWCVHIVRDITEMKRLEEEARERQRFEDISRAKSAFIATMSHELRTPLNSVIGFSELLLEQKVAPLTEKQARYIGHIHQSGKHLLDLINDILDVSRVEAGRIELARQPLPLDQAAEASLALARPQAEKAGVALGSEIPPDLTPVLADPVRLRQILFNLLSNGIKFTPEGGRITVTARQVPGARCQGSGTDSEPPTPDPRSLTPATGEWLEVAVADTGIGIKAEDIPKLFKEFGQLEAGKAAEKRGTGLGLALTKKLVELHGGQIWVESEGEGRGSTFAFTLPFAGSAGRET